MARRSPQPTVLPKPERGRTGPESLPVDGDVELAAWLGERVRRVALGLLAALITARAYWPSEPDIKAEAGTGLGWDLAILVVAGLAIASALIGGAFRVRWSWTDLAVMALMLLVGLSAQQAHDRRVAINLAWDWGAVGLAYVLVRNLPRTPGESKALVGALVATAVAVAVYGLYQVGVELPQTRAYYLTHRLQVLQQLGIPPGSPAELLYAKRLLDSNEPMATFALANSLAGFLVGPLVLMLAVGWENLVRGREARGSRWSGLVLAVPPALLVLVCLVLTKSRSAYVGLAAALAVLAWRERRRVAPRTLALAAAGVLVVVGALVAAGLATGRLDRLVLTESTKSLRYRWEYWVGAWRVITDRQQPGVFWRGHGPGNFAAPYLLHKLPQASEEIVDPHNLVLEVWATAGVWATLALVAALGIGLANLLAPSRTEEDPGPDVGVGPAKAPAGPGDPPRRTAWLVACAGGGWLAATLLGRLNPFEGDLLVRWLILGGAWLLAVVFGLPLWRRLAIPPQAIGAAALAVAVNLLAAGGIGLPAVALMLWLLIALGLNLRPDRGTDRLVDVGGRVGAFAVAMAWAALAGIFSASIAPFWRSEAAIAEAESALRSRPPQFDKAEKAYMVAAHVDMYSARPWLGLAYEKSLEWESRGAKVDDLRWKAIPYNLIKAVEPPRNAHAWSLHRERARVTRDLIRRLGNNLKPGDLIKYRGDVVHAFRQASLVYPTNATLHAELADASAEIGMFPDAVKEASEALRYDGLTPHADKKLAPALRKHLVDQLPGWEKSAEGMNVEIPGRGLGR